MRILFALPGLHRYDRGAEMAFISIATELAKNGDEVTLLGSGEKRKSTPYAFIHASSVRRERFEKMPSLPVLRNEYAYEDITFVPGLLCKFRPSDFDVTITCNYPFTNWMLRRNFIRRGGPPHVYVTQNGDWPAVANNSEYKLFGCDGLVCTNPEYFERNKQRWRSTLIPNGVDCERFFPGPSRRSKFGLPDGRLVVLMVSALIPSKRVSVGIEAVSKLPDVHLAVAGDGPMREEINILAAKLLPGRFSRLSVAPADMPDLYRSADIFLHLSKDEPSSLAFVEAISCGLPIVAHNSPRLRYIAGDDEFLMDTENASDVADQIAQARRGSSIDPNERSKKALPFSWPNIGKMYSRFLTDVVSS